MSKTTWFKMLRERCEMYNDDFDSLVTTGSKKLLTMEFEEAFGGVTEDDTFWAAWSEEIIYFGHEYDTHPYVMAVRRNPPIEARKILEVLDD